MTELAGAPEEALSRVVPAIVLPVFLAILNQTMIPVALPPIGADLGELTRLPWLIIGYMLALTISGPVYGTLGDIYGRKSMLMSALWIYVAGSLVCTLAPNFEILAFGRLIQGVSGGGLMALSQAIIGQAVSGRARGRVQGYFSTAAVSAAAAGPMIGGVLVGLFGWRFMFMLTIPIALAGAILLARMEIGQSEREMRRFDHAGFICLSILVISATLALEWMKTPGAGGAVALALLLAVLGFVGLTLAERGAANPLFPPKLLSLPAIWRADLLAAFHGATLISFAGFVPLYLRIVHGLDTLPSAFILLALTVGIGCGGFITGQLVSRTGRIVLYPAIGLAVSAAIIALLALAGGGMSIAVIAILLAICGLGMGTAMPITNIIVQHAAPPALRGAAAGGVTFSRSVGSVLGTTAMSLVLFAVAVPAGSAEQPANALLAATRPVEVAAIALWEQGFLAAFLTAAGFCLSGWAMALMMPLRRI